MLLSAGQEVLFMPFVDFSDMTWQPEPCEKRGDSIPSGLREMLLDHTSLTQRLKQVHKSTFFVRVIRHEWLEPTASESAFLSCGEGSASVREVLLFGSGRPVVFARSVLPASSLEGDNRGLLTLGDRPLGEYIFSQPGLHRGPIEIAKIPARQFNLHLDFDYGDEGAWGRRSLFYLNDLPISVCEVFLPQSGRG
ncbi:MAG: chorismate--pyruvate lyase family protein [Endozoicomonas sp.]